MEIWKQYKKFMSEDGTIFEKGPFVIESGIYDYKFLDPDTNETDYAIEQQLEYWLVDEEITELPKE
jgi:hypothetical protein